MKALSLITILLFLLFQSSAQVTLTINCQQDPQASNSNEILLDGNMIEYGLCGLEPAFYISIIDTNCNAWGTKFIPAGSNLQNDFGNYNNNGNCRPRVEYFFVYRQTDSLELIFMDSLINNWIPNDHVIAIWTPFYYDFTSVNSICPQLGNTLLNKWGNSVQADSMIVLFGVQGVPQSFTSDTLNNGGSISLSKTICPYSSLGINEHTNPNEKSLVLIVDLMGRETEYKPNTLLFYVYSDGTTEKVFRRE